MRGSLRLRLPVSSSLCCQFLGLLSFLVEMGSSGCRDFLTKPELKLTLQLQTGTCPTFGAQRTKIRPAISQLSAAIRNKAKIA